MKSIRIAIIDDQTLMRDGLKTILDLEEDMEVVATAANGREGYEIIKKHKPDVVLMDIRMPELNGVEATKLVKKDYPETVVIILTTFDDDDYIVEALCHGASGYLLKDMHGDKLIQSIRDAYDGSMMIPSNIAIKLASKISNMSSKSMYEGQNINDYDLTEREKDIGCLLIKGYTNKEIANELFISVGTVKNYITNVYSKIGVSNRTAAVLFLKKLNI